MQKRLHILPIFSLLCVSTAQNCNSTGKQENRKKRSFQALRALQSITASLISVQNPARS